MAVTLHYVITMFSTWSIWLLVCLSGGHAQSHSGIKASESQSVTLNSDVYVTCTLDSSIFSSNAIVWMRKQGSFETVLARQTNIESEGLSRYSMYYEQTTTGMVYTLSIRGVQYEDSATFECKPSTISSRKTSTVVAVCDAKHEPDVCECVLREGWSSPACFQGSNNAGQENFKQAAIALGVLFVVAVLVAIGLALIVGRDYFARTSEQKKKLAERRISTGKTNHVAIESTMYDEREKLTQDVNMSFGESEASGGVAEGFENPVERQRGRRAPNRELHYSPPAYPGKMPTTNNNNSKVDVHVHNADPPVIANGTRPKQASSRPGKGPADSTPEIILRPNRQNMYTARDDLSATPQHPQNGYPASNTPQSARSDLGPYGGTPAYHHDRSERGAYTDVPRDKQAGGMSQEWHDPARAPVEPRRLYFTGESPKDGVEMPNGNVNDDGVLQGSTAI